MKKIIFVLFFIFFNPLIASHVVGGYVNVKQLSQYEYNAEAIVYTDNNTISSTKELRLYRSNQGFYNLYQLVMVYQDTTYIDQGIHVTKYSVDFTLTSFAPGSYRLVLEEGGRGTFTNIGSNGGLFVGVDFTNFSTLNSTHYIPNSPPAFVTHNPVKMIHAAHNQFSSLAIDPDGDSITYEYGDAMGNHLNSTFVPVVPQTALHTQYSQAGGSYTVHQNGQVTWTPSHLGKFANSIIVKEYRNGQLIGINRKELTYQVVIGSTLPISNLSGVNITPSHWSTEIYKPLSWNMSFNIPQNCSVDIFGDSIKDQIQLTQSGGNVYLTIPNSQSTAEGWHKVVIRIKNSSIVLDNLLMIHVIDTMGMEENKSKALLFPNPFYDKLESSDQGFLFSSDSKLVSEIKHGTNEVLDLPCGVYYFKSKNTEVKLVKVK